MFVSRVARTNSVKTLAVDSEIMTETLERALAPLMGVGRFCNFCMFEDPYGQPRPYISYLYALAKWSFLMSFYYYPRFIYNRQIEEKTNINSIIPFGNILLIFISIYRFKVKMYSHYIIIFDPLILVFCLMI